MSLRDRLGLPVTPEPAPATPRKPAWVKRMEEDRAETLRRTGQDRVATKVLTR